MSEDTYLSRGLRKKHPGPIGHNQTYDFTHLKEKARKQKHTSKNEAKASRVLESGFSKRGKESSLHKPATYSQKDSLQQVSQFQQQSKQSESNQPCPLDVSDVKFKSMFKRKHVKNVEPTPRDMTLHHKILKLAKGKKISKQDILEIGLIKRLDAKYSTHRQPVLSNSPNHAQNMSFQTPNDPTNRCESNEV